MNDTMMSRIYTEKSKIQNYKPEMKNLKVAKSIENKKSEIE